MAIAIPSSEEEFASLSWKKLTYLSYQCATDGEIEYMGLLGYKKPIEVDGVGTVSAKLIGLNHDTYTEGGTAGFTFQLTDGMASNIPLGFTMNGYSTNITGWEISDMRSYNLKQLLKKLPSDLTDVIKNVNKETTSTTSATKASTTSDNLFLLSLVESIGSGTDIYADNPVPSNKYLSVEGRQYEYYELNGSTLDKGKKSHIISGRSQANGALSAGTWWLRSVSDTSTDFYAMDYDGVWRSENARIAFIPAAAFCIASTPQPPTLYIAGDWKGESNDQPQTLAWIDPDTDHKFYDELGSWSIIGSVPPSMDSPEGVLAIAEAAQSNPQGIYEKFKDKLTPAISFGDMSCQFRLVGVGQDNATDDPDRVLLTFLAEAALGTSKMADTPTNDNGYNSAATAMKSTVSTLYSNMDSSWKALVVPVTKEFGTSQTTKSIMTNQTLWIPSMYEVGLSSTNSYEPDCGTTYTYFVGESATDSSDKRKRGQYSSPTSFISWWLRSGGFSSPFIFARVGNSGTLYGDGAHSSFGVVIGFCVGPGVSKS